MSVTLLQYGYRMSKAALNMAGATMAKDLAESQVLCWCTCQPHLCHSAFYF